MISWKAAHVLAAVVLLAASPSPGQPSPGPASERPLPLSPEKQDLIRQQAKRPDLPTTTLAEPVRLDMVIPSDVELLALPQDVVSEVPSTTRYRYLKAGDVLAIVDPETRKVLQVIKPE
jgi:hypothetical protein